MLPQCLRQALRAAGDEPVRIIGVGVDDPEDFQDGVGEIGVPAAGTEPDLAVRLSVGEPAFLNDALAAMNP